MKEGGEDGKFLFSLFYQDAVNIAVYVQEKAPKLYRKAFRLLLGSFSSSTISGLDLIFADRTDFPRSQTATPVFLWSPI